MRHFFSPPPEDGPSGWFNIYQSDNDEAKIHQTQIVEKLWINRIGAGATHSRHAESLCCQFP
jgi:hypothetical protein